MDPLMAAAAAATVAWISIFVVIHLPTGSTGASHRLMRLVGAVAVAMLGLIVLGVPLPAWAPLLWLIGGALVVIARPRGAAAAA